MRISRQTVSNSGINTSMMSNETKCTVPRIKCAFHPNQFITNFCTCQSCLLPLCPACVKIHTNEHINLKKINPQYEPITDLLEEIYGEVDDMLENFNTNYKKIVEIDARVDTFRTTIQQKIASVKSNIISEVQKYFSQLDDEIQGKIDCMNYIQLLGNYKDQTKKIILGLKNVEKGFNPENQKIMRIAIKYKGDHIKKQLQDFQEGLDDFFKEVNNNFVTFSVREDYRQVINTCLENIRRVDVSDASGLRPVPNISQKIKQICERNNPQSKKELMKSINNFLSTGANKKKNEENVYTEYESYNSVSNQISKDSHCMLRQSTPNRSDKKRSLSKGKGLSVMQTHHNCFTSNIRHWKAPKAVNITQPIEFNRTALIRRNDGN